MLCTRPSSLQPSFQFQCLFWPWTTFSDKRVVCEKKWCIRFQAVLSASQWLNKRWKILQIAHVCTSVMMASTLQHDHQCSRCNQSRLRQEFWNTKAHVWLHSSSQFQRGLLGNWAPKAEKWNYSIMHHLSTPRTFVKCDGGVENTKMCCLTLLNLKTIVVINDKLKTRNDIEISLIESAKKSTRNSWHLNLSVRLRTRKTSQFAFKTNW